MKAPSVPGEAVVTVELYRQRDEQPYRTLRLAIEVVPTGGAIDGDREEG